MVMKDRKCRGDIFPSQEFARQDRRLRSKVTLLANKPPHLHFSTKDLTIVFFYDVNIRRYFKPGRQATFSNYIVGVNGESNLGHFDSFWRSTGLCPPDPHEEAYKFLLSRDMSLNIALIGSLPNTGLTHMRIHWLLDLVQIRVNSNGMMAYDYIYLDKLIRNMWQSHLSVGFELMGNPSGLFTDMENSTQVFWWRDMIHNLAQHYIDLYGVKYVSSWRFETWNEPDHHDFDSLNFTTKGFLNYYDACAEGLSAANKFLKLGGPGGSCHPISTKKSPICWAFLEHCVSKENFFTGNTTKLDFISFHKKGNGSSWEILLQEMETIKYIQQKYPTLSDTPIYNDEADPLKDWALPKTWRADATYAAIVVKIIAQHMHQYFLSNASMMKHKINFELLSNDNGFLSYFPNQFTQRTLLARFQMNNTLPTHVNFVRKPVYSTMGLLSQLCNEVLQVKTHFQGDDSEDGSKNFGTIATKCEAERTHRIAIMFYNSADTNTTISKARVELLLHHIPFYELDVKWALYHINNYVSNPYAAWKSMNSPSFPTDKQFEVIKGYEEPFVQAHGSLKNSSVFRIKFTLPRPGIAFLNVCSKGPRPVSVQNTKVFQISNTSVLISWKDDHNRCVLDHNIEHSDNKHGPFSKVNNNTVAFNSFWYSCLHLGQQSCTVSGCFRVQVKDYWNVMGPFSDTVCL